MHPGAFALLIAIAVAGCADETAPADQTPTEALGSPTGPSPTAEATTAEQPFGDVEVANLTFHLDSTLPSRSIDLLVPEGAARLNGTVSILDGFTRGFQVSGVAGCEVDNTAVNVPGGVPRVFRLDCAAAPGPHALEVVVEVGYAEIHVRLVARA